MHKSDVRKALARLTEHLQRKGAQVDPVYLPDGPDGHKLGVDDFLLTHSTAELEALVQAPPPAPKAQTPRVELLDDAPAVLSRPLALIGGQAYAATWLHIRTTTSETLNKAGTVVRHDPPIVETRRELFVLRGDGVLFGLGERYGLEDLGLQAGLSAPARDGKTMR